MQTFRLIRAFRDWTVGTIFNKEDGRWSSEGEFEDVSSHVCDTLLDVGGYFEDVTPVVWTPSVGQQVFLVTGAGEVKSKEFSNSDWFRLQNDFMGYFATREEAINRVLEVREMLHSEQ
jgi:hypothetical protein